MKKHFALTVLLAAPFLTTTAQSQSSHPTEEAVFAGGCFWCTESDFEKVEGVISAESGYTGGQEENPTYPKVSAGITGHVEAVKVVYDPKVVSYQDLLYIYWRSVDPTVENRQFCDKGAQYRTVIFYNGKEQKQAAETSRNELVNSKRFNHIYTELSPLTTFWPAEKYHQNYYKKNPIRYYFYRTRCGRDSRLEDIWGKDAGSHKP